MGDEIRDMTLKGETPLADSKMKVDNTVSKILMDRNSGAPLRFVDPDEMNPEEPWILRDSDEAGLIRRYWRRKEIEE